jgi:hypothetical protein
MRCLIADTHPLGAREPSLTTVFRCRRVTSVTRNQLRAKEIYFFFVRTLRHHNQTKIGPELIPRGKHRQVIARCKQRFLDGQLDHLTLRRSNP